MHRHGGQEIADVAEKGKNLHIFVIKQLPEHVLLDPEVPLTAEERAKIAMRLVSENMWGATRSPQGTFRPHMHTRPRPGRSRS